MATSDVLKAQHKDVGVSEFWIIMVPQARFKNTRAVAMLLLTMFLSTYTCKSLFSREKQKQILKYTYWTVPQVCDNRIQAKHKRDCLILSLSLLSLIGE